MPRAFADGDGTGGESTEALVGATADGAALGVGGEDDAVSGAEGGGSDPPQEARRETMQAVTNGRIGARSYRMRPRSPPRSSSELRRALACT
jgi:hypothetical protein